jgi:DNA/RNA endonuclease G (NUC1)
LIGASISVFALICVCVVFAAISLSTSTAQTQNFDGIGTTATATLPADWKVDKPSTVRTVGSFATAVTATNLAGGANLSSTAGNGIYNFGSGTTTTGPDRAIGFLSSGSATQSGNLYAQLANNTGGTLSGVQVSYDVEKYRNGSNPNGFRIQMFYSSDGSTWTSAGSDFLTSFAADANNSGFATAPGATVSVTNKILSVTVASGANLYLAWNYSVAATSTTTNAQALAIDNVSILGVSAGGPTNPTGTGNASPNTVDQGGTTLLTVTVHPGTNPASTAHTVSADLSSIGGSASQTFQDDGFNGAGDNLFSFNATVSSGAGPGAKSLPVTITETSPNARTAGTLISLTVNTPTPPTGVGAANPSSVAAGGTSLLTVTVTPGTHPTGTGISVTGNLSSIGGSSTQAFSDSGADGDVTAGDNIFSFSATVSGSTTAGLKSIPTTINDAQSRSGGANIALTVTSPTSNPTGTGTATPSSVAPGGGTLLKVTVTPGSGPTSTGIAVSSDLSSIGGSGSQQFFDNGSNGDVTPGDNIFSFIATVGATTTSGAKSLPFTISDAETRSGSGSIALTITVPAGAVVITQVYGGGGNSGATLKNDFIEIFNRSSATIDLSGWSVQYASAAATTAWVKTSLNGTLAPGQYYLIQEAAGTGGSVDLPTPDAVGSIPMSGTNANIALVSNNVTLATGCPAGNPQLIDLVGYGTAACYEGSAAAPGLGNTTADLRKRGGCKDTDDNVQDFIESSPSPRNKATTVHVCAASGDLSPEVESVFPANGAPGVDNNSDITVTFDEPVSVSANTFQISCANTGLHTAVITGGPTTFTINPDIDFGGAEQCTVTVLKNEVSDQDMVDPPDGMDADYLFSFTTAIARDPAEHMVMGNPSGAVTNETVPLNYLMMKPQYALSYNNDKGHSNWTSWHLDSTWTTGVADRQNDFRSDNTLPAGFKHVSSGYNFATYGFDRGHMTPSADRTSSVADNSATFLMTNMIPQASGNNQGPWGNMENYIRAQLNGNTNELYIVSGGTGTGGNSTTGHWDSILDTGGNTVNVPQFTWKVVMVLPNAVGDDVARVDGSTRTFAVIMPNNDNIRPDQWQKYLATVDQVEALSGFDFYSNVPAATQSVFEAKLDAINDTAPVASSSSATAAEDNATTITLSATDFNVNNVLTFTVASGPTHGTLGSVAPASCSNGICTTTVIYTPAADYNGPDSFTFNVNDGALDSASPATVTLNVTEVNDDPIAVNDSKQTTEDSTLNFAASDLTGNDSAGANESGQTLVIDMAISTPSTHGSVVLSAGQITYTPAADFNGPASFDYQVCDNGTTNGLADSKCTIGTVNVTVDSVNDNPVAVDDSATTNEDTSVTIDVVANDTDVDSGDTVTLEGVSNPVNGSVSINSGQAVFSPEADFHGTGSFDYSVSDGHGGTATGHVTVTVNSVNDNPVAVADSANTNEDNSVTIDVVANDTDLDGDARTLASVGSAAHGSVTIVSGKALYSPVANYNGGDSFTYVVSDGNGGQATGNVSVTVNAVNDAPMANSQSVNTNANTNVAITLTGNDLETPSAGLTFTVTSGPSHGSLSGAGANRTYSPALNYSGPDSFKFKVQDTGDGSSPALMSSEATVSINVNDTLSPTIVCNANIIADFNPAVNGAVVTYTVPAGTDNAPGATTTQTAGLASGATFPVGTTTNTFTVTDASGNTASCSFKVTVALTSIIGLDSVTITGSGYIDSYNSSGGYPATKGSLANVLSNGTITIGNSGKVWGNVRSTRAGVNMTGATQVTGNATAGTTVSRSGSATVGGTITNNALAPVMTLPSVPTCGPPYSSASGISGTYSYNASTGDLTLSGINTATLANGNYCFHNVTLGNSAQLKVNGPVVIKLTGTLNTSGATNINNTTQIPSNLQILSSYSGTNGVILGNSANAYAVIYAPNTGLNISGTAPLFGSIAGKTITLGGSGAIHYDTTLKTSWPAIWNLILGP